MKKILDSKWKTNSVATIGIVAVERVDGWKAYIGLGLGDDEEADAQRVADYGSPLTEPEARGFFTQLGDRTYSR